MAEQSQNNVVNECVNITMPKKLSQVVYGKPLRINESRACQMPKVPLFLRLENKDQQDYDPQVVSLGPYHHGKPNLQAAEDFKLKALEMFVADSGKDILFYYTKVLELVDHARNCYIEDYTKEFDDPTFAQMMLLDTCFTIIYILSQLTPQHYITTIRYLGDLVWSLSLRDIFLLENQIPFGLLKLLMCWRFGEDKAKEFLNEFLYTIIFGEYKGIGIASSSEMPLHLLDAFRRILVSQCSSNVKPTPNLDPTRWFKHTGNALRKCRHLRLHCCIMGRGKDDNEYSTKKYVHSFRSVTDLKSKGIHFKPSSTDSLKSISFKSGYFFPRLDVPIWFVSIYTKGFFKNMIAYELCQSPGTDLAVTSYINFMKYLIDSPKDVKELREKKILFTTLGSDEEVVKVYREINTYGVNNISIFHHVKEEIQAHYNSRAKTWLAELIHTYFRSPWNAIALLAATFLLVLTFLQTYFTINPVSD